MPKSLNKLNKNYIKIKRFDILSLFFPLFLANPSIASMHHLRERLFYLRAQAHTCSSSELVTESSWAFRVCVAGSVEKVDPAAADANAENEAHGNSNVPGTTLSVLAACTLEAG